MIGMMGVIGMIGSVHCSPRLDETEIPLGESLSSSRQLFAKRYVFSIQGMSSKISKQFDVRNAIFTSLGLHATKGKFHARASSIDCFASHCRCMLGCRNYIYFQFVLSDNFTMSRCSRLAVAPYTAGSNDLARRRPKS